LEIILFQVLLYIYCIVYLFEIINRMGFRILLSVWLCLVGSSLNSQNYYGVYPIEFMPLEIENPVTLHLSDDLTSPGVMLGFTFNFFGNNYAQLGITSNGYVTFRSAYFGNPSDYSIGESIPSFNSPLNSIFFTWADFNPAINPNSIIRYGTNGLAPYRVFIVEYIDVPLFSCQDSLYSGQLQLFEESNIIEVHIANKAVCPNTEGWSSKAVQGIQNAIGTFAYTVPGRSDANSVWTAENDAWRFEPNPGLPLNNTLSGRVVADLNGNCILDSIDYAISGHPIFITGFDGVNYTDDEGYYSVLAGVNVFNISTSEITIPSNVVCPSSGTYAVLFADTSLIYDTLDFYIQPLEYCTDLQCSILPIANLQSCADNTNHHIVTTRNFGFKPQEGFAISVLLPDSMELISAEPNYSQNSGNLYTWIVSDTLYFWDSHTIQLHELVNCDVADLTLKCIQANVESEEDCYPQNNETTLCMVVNDLVEHDAMEVKSPSTSQYFTQVVVEGNERYYEYKLEYNYTGENPLQRLKLIVTLPIYFDPTWMEMLASTHELSLFSEVNGTWEFERLEFPEIDSNQVYSGTSGSVLFKIRSVNDLLPNQILGIRASIEFNTEIPFFTNYAYIQRPGPSSVAILDPDFNIHPNPTNDFLNLDKISNKINNARIFDITGKQLKYIDVISSNQAVQLDDLSSGIYFIALYENTERISIQKFVISKN
jgi:hypothetical protein